MKIPKKHKLIALIPARSGSERLKDKNILKIKKKHLIGIAIEEAIKSKLFSEIVISSDSKRYLNISKKYGHITEVLRPAELSRSDSPDVDWVEHALKKVKAKEKYFTHFFILRPSNPFRSFKTIVSAWKLFNSIKSVDSLRAVQLCKEHPGKMWLLKKRFMKSFIKSKIKGQPSYNNQYKVLPRIYVQNACIEISKIEVVQKYKSITGKKIVPFFTAAKEGFDINSNADYQYAKLF
ncbi:acylneuraminate cytidylyltransferase family protein [Pelagibacteraceae bacterium]|nr:acylneuraminate cytidylyltransferase family protein [Pelagibacteraceae bacterium]